MRFTDWQYDENSTAYRAFREIAIRAHSTRLSQQQRTAIAASLTTAIERWEPALIYLSNGPRIFRKGHIERLVYEVATNQEDWAKLDNCLLSGGLGGPRETGGNWE